MTVQQATIPDFLIEMSKRMREQDNRGTRDPIWCVRAKTYITGATGYGDHYDVVDSENESTTVYSDYDGVAHDFVDYVREHYPEAFDAWLNSYGRSWIGEDLSQLGDYIDCVRDFVTELDIDSLECFDMQEIETDVAFFFTEEEAKRFIDSNQHNYPPLHTFVKALPEYSEMVDLRNWILSLTSSEANHAV